VVGAHRQPQPQVGRPVLGSEVVAVPARRADRRDHPPAPPPVPVPHHGRGDGGRRGGADAQPGQPGREEHLARIWPSRHRPYPRRRGEDGLADPPGRRQRERAGDRPAAHPDDARAHRPVDGRAEQGEQAEAVDGAVVGGEQQRRCGTRSEGHPHQRFASVVQPARELLAHVVDGRSLRSRVVEIIGRDHRRGAAEVRIARGERGQAVVDRTGGERLGQLGLQHDAPRHGRIAVQADHRPGPQPGLPCRVGVALDPQRVRHGQEHDISDS